MKRQQRSEGMVPIFYVRSREVTRSQDDRAASYGRSFLSARLSLAMGLLAGLLGAGIYTAQEESMESLHSVQLYSFDLVLGAVLGVLTEEAGSR